MLSSGYPHSYDCRKSFSHKGFRGFSQIHTYEEDYYGFSFSFIFFISPGGDPLSVDNFIH